jgi:XTP/dITP diphosphohydrolase
MSTGAVMKKIIVATGNKGKLKEITEILANSAFELISMGDVWQPTPEIEETGSTFFQNAMIKADWVFKNSGDWALADDSGLEVDFLDGAPGVRSARYAGDECDNEANKAKLLDALCTTEVHQRTARFRCVMVLKTGNDSYITADGVCEGIIGFKERGQGGFGYDPLFIPDSESLTFAELSSEKKNLISHRGRALRILCEKINGLST